MIRISEGPTATKRDEARVPNFREDHGRALLLRGRAASSTVASFEHQSWSGVARRPAPDSRTPCSPLSSSPQPADPAIATGSDGRRDEPRAAFWAALTFLAYLQIAVALLNLCPIPGWTGTRWPSLTYPKACAGVGARLRLLGVLLVLLALLLFSARPGGVLRDGRRSRGCRRCPDQRRLLWLPPVPVLVLVHMCVTTRACGSSEPCVGRCLSLLETTGNLISHSRPVAGRGATVLSGSYGMSQSDAVLRPHRAAQVRPDSTGGTSQTGNSES
jgi:hypothetical protein